MPAIQNAEKVPVKIVGSSVFGAYPTISAERTYNMFISLSGDKSEAWLTNFAGYSAVKEFFTSASEGRGIYHSVRGGFLICVVAATVFRVNTISGAPINIGTIGTSTGEVYIDENLFSQICIVDGSKVYIYNYDTGAFAEATLSGAVTSITPNYITYQNTYFIFGNALTTNAGSDWYVYKKGTGATELDFVQTLKLQTKPDFAKAVQRIPGAGNNVVVFGTTVAEIWTDVGGSEIYKRNSSVNIDYGCVSVSTIAANDEFVVWLGLNEKTSPAVMIMSGAKATFITTDGINHLLERVQFPSQSSAYFYDQDGHLFYVLSFLNSADNFTICYDFETKMWFDLTDWDFSTFPARQVSYFDNNSYFISYKDGFLYEISSEFTRYDIDADADKSYEIPRVRITNTFRLQEPENFIVKNFSFVIESGTTENAYEDVYCFGYLITEQGQVIVTESGDVLLSESGYCKSTLPRVDLAMSKNGGISFSNWVPYYLKGTGNYNNQPRFNQLGAAQQITFQFRFWDMGRVLIKNGVMELAK